MFFIVIFRAKQLMTRRSAWITVTALCAGFGLLNIHVFIMYGIETNPNSTVTRCTIMNSNIYWGEVIIPWIDLVLYTVMPSVIIIACNVGIVSTLVRSRVRKHGGVQGDTTVQKSISKIIPMLLVVSTVFVLSTLPIAIFYAVGEYITLVTL